MKSDIVIVSLGSGDPDLLNIKTVRILREAGSLILRTSRHPIASWLTEQGIRFSTLDHLYSESEDFDSLNQKAADCLIRLASGSEIVYAVPDAATDQTVRTLFRVKPENLAVSVIPGLSAYDLYLSSSLGRLTDTSVVLVPAVELTSGFFYDPNRTLLVTELNDQILAGQVKLFLSDMLDDEYSVVLLQPDGGAEEIPLWHLDRHAEIDHRHALLVPGSDFSGRNRFVMNDLAALMDRLRSPSGCPWDRIQTHETLRSYMIEEAWECVASIDQQDMDHLCEELGDLLFQIVFHSSIGQSYDEFTLDDVISSICLKMIRRHPHVFAARELNTPESVRDAWEKIKQEETGHRTAVSSLEDVSAGLPSLKYAAKLFRKLDGTPVVRSDASSVMQEILGLVTRMRGNPDKTDGEAFGRLLLLCAELGYIEGLDGELILRRSADRLKKRLKSAEKKIIEDGKSLEHLTFDDLGVYLNHVEDEIE